MGGGVNMATFSVGLGANGIRKGDGAICFDAAGMLWQTLDFEDASDTIGGTGWTQINSGSGGSGRTETSLYIGSTITGETAQNITLSDNLSNYDDLLISFYVRSTTGSTRISATAYFPTALLLNPPSDVLHTDILNYYGGIADSLFAIARVTAGFTTQTNLRIAIIVGSTYDSATTGIIGITGIKY